MTLPASSDTNLLEFLQLRSLRRPQSFSQFQLSHRPRLGGSPFLRQGRVREPQARLGKSLRSWIPPRATPIILTKIFTEKRFRKALLPPYSSSLFLISGDDVGKPQRLRWKNSRRFGELGNVNRLAGLSPHGCDITCWICRDPPRVNRYDRQDGQ